VLFDPGLEAAVQRADTLDALFLEEQRHTGASSFVRSSAVKDDVAVARDLGVSGLEFGGTHAHGAG